MLATYMQSIYNPIIIGLYKRYYPLSSWDAHPSMYINQFILVPRSGVATCYTCTAAPFAAMPPDSKVLKIRGTKHSTGGASVLFEDSEDEVQKVLHSFLGHLLYHTFCSPLVGMKWSTYPNSN